MITACLSMLAVVAFGVWQARLDNEEQDGEK